MRFLHRGWAAVAAPVLFGLALAPAPAPGDTPSKPYRDKVYKFSLKMFPEWEQVPVEVGEKFEIAKFCEPGSRGDPFRPEIHVLRLNKNTKNNEGPVTGTDPKKDSTPKELLEAIEAARVKSVFDLAFRSLIVPDGHKNCDPASFKKITSGEKIDGKFWVHEIPRPDTGDKRAALVVILAAFERDGVEYGIRFTGPARRRDDFEAAMKTIAKSFVFHDDKAKEVETIAVLDGVNISPKRRSDIEKGMVAGWGVEVSPKKNYVVIYNTKGNKNKPLAKLIAERIERIREQVYEVQFPPAQKIDAVSIVRVCADRNEYHNYGGPGGSAGYWNSGSEELVFYDASPARKVDDDTLAVLYHEAFHQFIFYSVGNVAPHSWFNEGHGDYYAGSKYVGGKFKIEPFDWRVGTVKNAIRQGPRSFKMQKDEKSGKERKVFASDKGYTPLKDLVAFSQRDYYSYPGVSYAQGWSLIYFLREEVPKKKAYREKWGKILDKYFNALKREVAKEGALTRGGHPDEPDPGGPSTPPAPKEPPKDPKEPKPGEPGDPPEPTGPEPEPEPGPDGGGEGGEEPPPDPGFQPMQEGEASESALETALREAFEGVDMAELEAAWAEFTKKVSG